METHSHHHYKSPVKKFRYYFFEFFILFLLITIHCFSQESNNAEKKSIQKTIDSFFEALEKQDTVLYKSIAFTNGQIWVMRHRNDSIIQSMRTFNEDIKKFSPESVIYEKPLAYDINVHNEVAIAWVPQTLNINDTFSHCGIDIFTLLKINGKWKIASVTYSVEPEGCDAIKKEYNLK